jgi:hypothetical protein
MRRFWYVLITMILIIAMTEMGWGVTPYTMSSGDYTEAFTNISILQIGQMVLMVLIVLSGVMLQ